MPGPHTYPGAVLGGAPNAKLAPFGDIYFAFDFSTQFGYFLTNEHGVDVTSNSYGTSDDDNDGYDAASQEADIIHDGVRTTPIFSTGNGAPGYGTDDAAAAVRGHQRRRVDAVRRDRLGLDRELQPGHRQRRHRRGPTAARAPPARRASTSSPTAPTRPATSTLNTVLDGHVAWETWGGTSRSTPVAVGATALVYQA